MRRIALVGLSAVMGMVALVGCGSSDSDTTSSAPAASSSGTATGGATAKPVKIAFVTGVYSDLVKVQEEGLKETVEPGGGSVEVFNAQFDPNKMLQQCQDVVTSGRFNAVALSADPTGGPGCVKAIAGKLPIVTIDISLPNINDIKPQMDGVVGAVSLSIPSNTEQTVQLVKDACEGIDPCKVAAEITQPPDTFYGPGIDAIKKLPNVEVVQTISGMFDPSVIAQKMPDVLTAHPDLNVFLSTADSQALAAIPAIKQAGLQDQVKVIGNGGSRLGAKAVAEGTLFGSQGTWPKQEAAVAAKMLTQAVNGQPVEPNTVNATTMDKPLLLTKDTVGQFKPEWGAQ